MQTHTIGHAAAYPHQLVAQTSVILTQKEAQIYVKAVSPLSFRRWCKRWQVKPAQRGRFSRSLLDAALNREGRARV